MRIVQLIDSVAIGGAERMAVSYANSVLPYFGYSALVTTRAEGPLKQQLDPRVNYLFLGKKKTIDVSALQKLKTFCQTEQIDLIHAHSTSYATAILLKALLPSIKIIWHNHYGNSLALKGKRLRALQLGSYFFDGIIACNQPLLSWCNRRLNCSNAIYLPNFTEGKDAVAQQTFLKGVEGKRVLLLANLREEKNHSLLLDSIKMLQAEFTDWSFHLVGKDLNDAYSQAIKKKIEQENWQDVVFLYGSCPDTHAIIQQAEVCVLSSKIEGLPVALIEYGFHSKAVVATTVGEIPNIVNHQKNGLLASSNSATEFTSALRSLMQDARLRKTYGAALKETLLAQYGQQLVLDNYIEWVTKH